MGYKGRSVPRPRWIVTMPLVSAALEIVLTLTCVGCARTGVRSGNDFLVVGFLWVAAASFVGAFNLGGVTTVDPTHRWLAAVGRGPATAAMALGLAAAWFGAWRHQRLGAVVLTVVGATAIHLLLGTPSLGPVTLLLGGTLPATLLLVFLSAARRGAVAAAVPAMIALVSFVAVAFVVPRVALPPWLPLERVDVFHLVLVAAYLALDRAVVAAVGRGGKMDARGVGTRSSRS